MPVQLSARPLDSQADFVWFCDGSAVGRNLTDGLMTVNAGVVGTDLLVSSGATGLGLSVIDAPAVGTKIISPSQPVTYGLTHTLMVVALVTANPAATKRLFSVRGTTSDGIEIQVLTNGDLQCSVLKNLAGTATFTVTGGAGVGSPHVYCASYTSGATTSAIYVDGKPQTVVGAVGQAITTKTSRVFSVQGGIANTSGCGTVYAAFHWNRVLSAVEVSYWSQNWRKLIK